MLAGGLLAHLSQAEEAGGAKPEERSVFDEPVPLDQLLVPKSRPLSAEQLTLCVKQGAEIQKLKARSKEEAQKLAQHQLFLRQMGQELEAMKVSRGAADEQAVSDFERAYIQALEKQAAETDSYKAKEKAGQSAVDTFNKTCGGRLVAKETQDAVRQDEGDRPSLRSERVAVAATPEQQKEIDAYRKYLTGHIKTERLSAEIAAHRKRNTVAEGSTSLQVSMTISPTGSLQSHAIKVSSGDPALDAIVLAGVQRAQPFAPPPKLIASMPIVWKLAFFGSHRR